MSKPATVVSCRGKRFEEWADDADFVYVGRAVPRRGYPSSGFGNPYRTAEQYEIDFTIAILQFERQNRIGVVRGAFGKMLSRLGELRGKKLGCWCGEWKPGEPEIGCHAVVIAKIANEMFGDKA